MRDWTGEEEAALRGLVGRLRAVTGRDPGLDEVCAASGLPPETVRAMMAGPAPGEVTRSVLSRRAEPGGEPAGAGGWTVRVLDGLRPTEPAGPGTVLHRFVCERGGERLVLDARDAREGVALAACLAGEARGALPRPPVLPRDAAGAEWPMPYRDAGGNWAGAKASDAVLLDDPHRRFGTSYLAWVEAVVRRA